ncbi:MAG: 5-histidylcysteine sulfoxide synthase [Bacteroidales bacterium]|nr:5-histidylcysteine sulfoxide synthase [Bacteroidales bacterium]MDD4176706.1 5-histidylcysteine sulfoxide synthase [Bacteroidales bacterium]MDD4740783.1 5-histidylcysteine sulfoxide synthase [Bacteroidales bacterium]
MKNQLAEMVTRTIVLDKGEAEDKRKEILEYFQKTYQLHEQLYETLRSDETFYMRADPLRHPLVFYLGHTAAFFINKLILARLLDKRVNARFESIFAIGVDEMSWDDLDETHYEWPSVAEVRRYRKEVRQVVEELIATLPLEMPITWTHPWWTIMMGIEHERIHLETSSVLIRQLPIDQVKPQPLWEICTESGLAPVNELIPVKGGEVLMGKKRDHPLYGWDNEYGLHAEEVESFDAAKFLVSNKEFLEFVKDDGYATEKYWTEEGWRWRNYRNAGHPVFWIKGDSGMWKLRTMTHIIEMPWNWPVEVNYLEAKAFTNWKSERTGETYRLPTEEEWCRLRETQTIPDQPFWEKAPGNINLEYFASPVPVDKFRFGEFYDIIGNVWQWTETPINGFPGFEVHPFYDDFSTPTFDMRHNLIKGGSWISTGNEATRDSRYAFRRHFFQHAGFRYIRSDAPVKIQQTTYETDALVSQYCESHYGKTYFDVPIFAARSAGICIKYMSGKPHRKALDLGCAVGRTTFELARHFDFVTGLDFSARFIKIADDLLSNGRIRYVLPEEGELVSFHEVTIEESGFADLRDKVEFYQGDAVNLSPKYSGYDLIFAGNLIDRLYDPGKFLDSIHERINGGGLLILASPYTWLETYTPRQKWLGGYKKDGEPVTTLDGLHQHLDANFTLIGEPFKIPFVIRETRNKFQHTLTEFTVWEKKS